MTPSQADKQAKKRWGNGGFAEMYQRSSSPERREKASAELRAARERMDAINTEIRKRLAALDWYQELMREASELRKSIRDNESLALYHRFHVGKRSGMFGTVLGSGDSFEEAFAKADKSNA